MPPKVEFIDVLGYPLLISLESLDNDRPWHVSVTNELNPEDLSNLYTNPSASYVTKANTLVGAVDAGLKERGLIPSWVVEKPIPEDGIIKPNEPIILDRILGAETFYQLSRLDIILSEFTPAVYLVPRAGEPLPVIQEDMNKYDLADFDKLVIGVQFKPEEKSLREIVEDWQRRFHGLPEGDVDVHEVIGANGKPIIGAYDLFDGLMEFGTRDLSAGQYPLQTIYLQNGKKTEWYVDGNSLAAVVDKRLGGRGVYRVEDTLLGGTPYESSNILLRSVPGLELAIMKIFSFTDPRDVGILTETPESNRSNGYRRPNFRTETGEGKLSLDQTMVKPGMGVYVTGAIQGLYDRQDHTRKVV